MKRRFVSIFAIAMAILASCSLEQLEDASKKMGNNILGQETATVEVSAEKTSASELAGDNENLKSILVLISGTEDLGSVGLITPLDSQSINALNTNYSTSDGKNELEKLKNIDTDLADEDKKSGIKSTAELLDGFIPSVETIESDSSLDTDTKKLLTGLKTTLETIKEVTTDGYSGDETVSEGDVIALQYTVSLLQEVANAIPEEGIQIKKDGNDELLTITSTDVINALFGKEEDNKETQFKMSDISYLLDTEDGTNVATEVIKSVESYLNIVSTVSNMTGGVDAASLISSYIKKN